jgi:sulfite reductase alpha subunit-like flavoprotein
VLHKLYAAFSRDQANKVYVQDILFQNQDAIWTGITERGAILLLCG